MSTHVDREYEAYRKDDAEARAILDLVAEEKRSVTAEEEQRFDALIASRDAHKKRADQLKQSDDDAKEVADAVRTVAEAVSDVTSGRSDAGRFTGNDELIRAIREVSAAQLGRLEETERVVVQAIDLQKRSEFRAIADFSDNGALYTTDFATQIAIYKRTLSPWIDLSSIINADNGRPLNLPKLTADPTTYTPGEGTAITESTPTIGSAALTTKAYKGLSYVSAEAEEDELVGLLPILARQQARSIGLSFGSDSTTAVLAAINNGGTATGLSGGSTATFVGYEDLLDLKYGRAVPYRVAGVFVASNGMIKKMRKYTDKNGQYLWQPAIAAGQPATFDGNAVYEDPNLAAPASATKSAIFGDPSAALVIKQMPIRTAVSTDFKFDTDQVAVKSVWRAGLAVPDPAALAYIVSANT